MRSVGFTLTTLASLVLVACNNSDATSPSIAPSLATSSSEASAGVVYTLTNQASNAVRAYARAADGTLTFVADYPTGGAGTGAGLGSQGALSFGRGKTILAVNAASNQISALAIKNGGLTALNTVASGGSTPISVTSHGEFVFVLNAGAPANISGFRQTSDGRLTPVANSTRALSTADPAPAQISFSPDGRFLVVTEKGTNNLVTYAVDANGNPGNALVTPSAGQTPFGFAFTNRGDYVVVSEAFGGAVNGSASSSYQLGDLGRLNLRTASLGGGQTAACWIATTPNNQFAYASNTGSRTVTGYRIAPNGTISLIDQGVTAVVSGSATDATVSRNGRFLYVVGGSSHTIDAYAIAANGSLTSLGAVTGLPAGDVSVLAQ